MIPTNAFEWLLLIAFLISTPLFIWGMWATRRRKPRK
jgi:hypothetical protein